jgi:hypothetical protein
MYNFLYKILIRIINLLEDTTLNKMVKIIVNLSEIY